MPILWCSSPHGIPGRDGARSVRVATLTAAGPRPRLPHARACARHVRRPPGDPLLQLAEVDAAGDHAGEEIEGPGPDQAQKRVAEVEADPGRHEGEAEEGGELAVVHASSLPFLRSTPRSVTLTGSAGRSCRSRLSTARSRAAYKTAGTSRAPRATISSPSASPW